VEEGRHSQTGIASFVLSLISVALACTFFLLFFVSFGSFPDVLAPGLCLLPLTSLVLGIIGLVRKGPKRLFALLGTVLSALVLLALVCWFVLMSVVLRFS